MTNQPKDDDSMSAWHADWESSRRRKLTLGVPATPSQRLDWLEQVLEIAAASGALARRRSARATIGYRNTD